MKRCVGFCLIVGVTLGMTVGVGTGEASPVKFVSNRNVDWAMVDSPGELPLQLVGHYRRGGYYAPPHHVHRHDRGHHRYRNFRGYRGYGGYGGYGPAVRPNYRHRHHHRDHFVPYSVPRCGSSFGIYFGF
ncbi:MAG: hypothetical protein GY768_02785 [Planctomycetaceae bacterium]|nr:hypothetical protein [Planctomycetaceae bacterium]